MIERQADKEFKLVSKYEPTGDQPTAIASLVDGIKAGKKEQILLGATGTGKTISGDRSNVGFVQIGRAHV